MIVWLVFLLATVTVVQPQTPKPTSIVYGEPAVTGQFPYQVFLEIYSPENLKSYCSGSVISDQWILTAAHCFQQTVGFLAIMGSVNPPNGNWIAMFGNEFYVHEKYDPRTTANDVTVAKLPQKLPFGVNIAPVQIATDAEQNYYGDVAVASGWGKTLDADLGIGPNLQYTTLKVISNQECFFLYPSRIFSSTLCAAGTTRGSTCRGDSGGPLVSLRDGKQIGITSFSKPSCQKGEPQAFVRVTSFVDWIRSKTGLML